MLLLLKFIQELLGYVDGLSFEDCKLLKRFIYTENYPIERSSNCYYSGDGLLNSCFVIKTISKNENAVDISAYKF